MYDLDEHKNEVKLALAKKGLGSYMNDTKWRELLAEIDKLPFPPPYQRKDILRSEPEPTHFDSDVWYLGDWEEGIYPFFSIEWIRIRPRYLKHVAQFERALQSIGQVYEKDHDSIWIYGYR